MALNGSFGDNFTIGFRLQVDWSVLSQDFETNSSVVKADFYLISLDRNYTSSTSKTQKAQIWMPNQTTYTQQVGLSNISGNQKKLVHSQTTRVYHQPDGQLTFNISARFEFNGAQLWVFSEYDVDISGNVTLNPIPRPSTVSSAINWTAGTQNLAVQLSNRISGVTHDITLAVEKSNGDWEVIATRSNIGNSYTIALSKSDHQLTYQTLNLRKTARTLLQVETYHNGSYIGLSEKNGTVSGVTPGSVSFNPFTLGSNVPATINNYNSYFAYNVRFEFYEFENTFQNVGQSPTFIWSDLQKQAMFDQLPNATRGTGTAYVSTYYINGATLTLVTNETAFPFTTQIGTGEPTFEGDFTYRDSNAATVTLTGNNQYLVQNKSTLLIELPASSKALAYNGATITKYIASVSGMGDRTKNYSSSSAVTFDFGTVTANTDLTVSLKAIDSRGNFVVATKKIFVVPYSPPKLNVTVARENNLERATTITMNGSISLVNVLGVDKNSLPTLRYRKKESTVTTWEAWINVSKTLNGSDFIVADIVLDLDDKKAFNFEFEATDALTGKDTQTQMVGVGNPMFFVDHERGSFSINQFPTREKSIEFAGDFMFNDREFAVEKNAVTPATAGWYRIASSAMGIGNNLGKFEILANSPNYNSYSVLDASIINGSDDCTIKQSSHTNGGAMDAINQARLVYHNTPNGNYAYLEVYKPSNVALNLTVRKISGSGWTLIDPNTSGSIPSGYTSKAINLRSGGISTSGDIFGNDLYANNSIAVADKSATLPSAAGWYRIASTKVNIGNNMAIFQILGQVSGKHSFTTLIAGISYGDSRSVTISPLSHTFYSNPCFMYARIVFHTTYSGNFAHLEIYTAHADAISVSVRKIGGYGWDTLPLPNTPGVVPDGYSSKEAELMIGGGVLDIESYKAGGDANNLGGKFVLWKADNAAANRPTDYQAILNIPAPGNSDFQIASSFGAGNDFRLRGRHDSTGNWKPWERVQTVVESGSNANGEYVRYADGIQICWKSESITPASWLSVASGGGTYTYVANSWVYPATFLAGAPVAKYSGGDIGGAGVEHHYCYGGDHAATTTEDGIFGYAVTAGSTAIIRQLFAIGRWR